ncbi:MAG: hypothetical protein ETSY1_07830 [Candidatus Entotheonella factor]|uniref:P-type ATPase A domain-containing protein n=1 Tax=Entotheonella factor TaxID=1429438 RepID=W4LTF6_ENTF1|nr:MAG: hypothetical protein ETSY1_07830 [Candidatus Entotheonella factor]
MLTELILAGGAAYAGVKSYAKQSKKKRLAKFLGTPPFSLSEEIKATALQAPTRDEIDKTLNRELAIASFSLGLSAMGAWLYPPLIWCSFLGLFLVGRHVYSSAYTSLAKDHRANGDTVISIVITMFLLQGYYVLSAIPIFYLALNRKLVSKVKDESRHNFVDVFKQMPRSVWVSIDGVEVETAFDTLQQGDIVVVGTGATIPVDGTITAGVATIDQQILTGEAQPVEKGVGDPVSAATLVLSGRLSIRVDRAGEETTAAHIGSILNQTVDYKTKIQLWAEAIAERTVAPTLLCGGLVLPVLGSQAAASLLFAVPRHRTTVIASIGILNLFKLASRKGLLIKDGRTLDLLNEVDTVVFDKTGTLTETQPHISRIHTCNGYPEYDLLRYAAAAETNQSHPIAHAIRQEATERRVDVPAVDEAVYLLGYGLNVTVEDQCVQVGSARYLEMENLDIPLPLLEAQKVSDARGHSLVYVAINGNVQGALELAPTIRPEAQAIIKRLRQMGIQSTYIISGDHKAPTQALAEALGIDAYFAEVLPDQKADLIDALQREGKSVCYIGDGINDGIALKKAKVSVSLRGASSVAMDTAQVVLMDGSLRHLGDLFDLARSYQTNMKTSLMLIWIPTLLSIGGALFFQLGFFLSVTLQNLGLLAGVAHSTWPLMQAHHRSNRFSKSDRGRKRGRHGVSFLTKNALRGTNQERRSRRRSGHSA